MSTFRRALVAARVTVTPPPTSVLHTTTILSKLATYGEVVRFTKKRLTRSRAVQYDFHYKPNGSSVLADGAVMSVEFVPPNPDPEQHDFYNVFGYKDRHYPPGKSFQCTVTNLDSKNEEEPAVRFRKNVRHQDTDNLQEDLYWSNVPPSLRSGLSFRLTALQANEKAKVESSEARQRDFPRLLDIHRRNPRSIAWAPGADTSKIKARSMKKPDGQIHSNSPTKDDQNAKSIYQDAESFGAPMFTSRAPDEGSSTSIAASSERVSKHQDDSNFASEDVQGAMSLFDNSAMSDAEAPAVTRQRAKSPKSSRSKR